MCSVLRFYGAESAGIGPLSSGFTQHNEDSRDVSVQRRTDSHVCVVLKPIIKVDDLCRGANCFGTKINCSKNE